MKPHRHMRFLFYAGCMLMMIAFLLTAADPYLSILGVGGMWVPTYDVWYAYSPGSLIITQIRIERLLPALWDPVIVTLLQIPGWLLFGIPGLMLVWLFRTGKALSPEALEEYERHKESLFVIDTLSREARLDENYDDTEDDMSPVHLMFDLDSDPDHTETSRAVRGDIPAGYPSPDYLEDWSPDLTRDDADGLGGVNYEAISSDLDVSALPPPGSILAGGEKIADTDSLDAARASPARKDPPGNTSEG